MSNNNAANFPLLFNNNKSLYGPRTQTNQSSKKISIIEDKTTLEPVRPAPTSPNVSSTQSNTNFQRTTSVNIPSTSTELSSSQMQQQIQIQKQALNSIDLDKMHRNIYEQLEEWKNTMYNRVDSMKTRMLEENSQAHSQLTTLQSFMKNLLEERIIRQLLTMKNNPQSINNQELDDIEQHLEKMNDEIDFMKRCDLQLDSSNTQIVGDLQLHKMTDSTKRKLLLQPPPFFPPAQPVPSLQPSITTTDKTLDQTPIPSDSTELKPLPPVWTDATRQGLNSLSHHLLFRLLIPNNIREELIGTFDIELFNSMLELSCESPIECILTIINQNDLEASIDILMDVIEAFQCSSTQYELRLLYPKKFIPIITGKRTERLDRLKEKYQLDMIKVFPQTCPQSDERVILLRCQHTDYIIYCLREIIQNVLEQGHFDDDDDENQSYTMYDPSENYDELSAHEYGGYKSNDICELTLTSNTNKVASTEDLTESKQRSTASAYSSSSSSVIKHRHNSEEVPLNDDDTELESDDDEDDEFKRSKTSEDKRIFVKKLNSVKGRQVGLLIGPFGQHITQIREQTGAKIHLTNDDNEPSVIKGTKTQINQALRLIRECLQTQKPIPRTAFKGGRRR